MSKVTNGRIEVSRSVMSKKGEPPTCVVFDAAGDSNQYPTVAVKDSPSQYVPASIADELLALCERALDATVEFGATHGDYSLAHELMAVILKATNKG